MSRSAFVALAMLSLPGCPDPDARFQEFVNRSARDMAMGPQPDEAVVSHVFDVTGSFLLAIALPPLNPNGTIQFISQTTLTPNSDGTASMDMVVTPLDATSLMPISGHDISIKSIAVNADGQFSAALGTPTMPVTVPAAANGIVPGMDITAYINLNGTILSKDNYCGTITGMTTTGLIIKLEDYGAIWGAIRVAPGTVGMALPPASTMCNAPTMGDMAMSTGDMPMSSADMAMSTTDGGSSN